MPGKKLRNKTHAKKIKRKKKKVECYYYEIEEEPQQTYYYDEDYEIKPNVQSKCLQALKKLTHLQLQAPGSRLRKSIQTTGSSALEPPFTPSPPSIDTSTSDRNNDIESEIRSQSMPRVVQIENVNVLDDNVSVLDQLMKQRELLNKSQLSFSKQGGCTAAAFARFMDRYKQRPFLRDSDSVYGNEPYFDDYDLQGFL